MLSIWRGSGISNLDKEEDMINLCHMAINDEVYHENSFEFIFDELFKIFNDSMDEYKNIRLKNKELKKTNLSLVEEKNSLAKEKEEC